MSAPLLPGDGDPRHGLNGYSNLKCRCDVCRAANRDWQADARERRASYAPHLLNHGNANTYRNYGCRCDQCRIAATEDERRRREARRATSP